MPHALQRTRKAQSRSGRYKAWSILLLVRDGAALAIAKTIVTSSQVFAATVTPDYVPVVANTTAAEPGLLLLGSHYQQQDYAGTALGALRITKQPARSQSVVIFFRRRTKRAVTREGFAAVGFVSALTGHRYHDRPMREWFISEPQECLAVSAHDVQMVLDYLGTRGDLNTDRVGMVAEGSGGRHWDSGFGG